MTLLCEILNSYTYNVNSEMSTESVNKRGRPRKIESSNDTEVGSEQISDHPIHIGHIALNYMHVHFIK